MESKYLSKFTRLQKEGAALFKLYGNRLLIEVLPKEELKVGSLYVATNIHNHKTDTTENMATLGVVLLTGAGYYDDTTGEDIPLELKPGNVVLLSNYAMKYYSQFPGLADYTQNTIALTREDEVHMVFPDLESFQKIKGILND
jgi:co-chaperonin GroES (HSP10)